MMKNSQLVFLDMLVGIFLMPTCIVIRIIRKNIFKCLPIQCKGVLIVKFLGAGNFLALKDSISNEIVDIVSASSNQSVLSRFSLGKNVYLIDDSSFLRLLITGLACCIRLCFSRYEQVINLETESKFAKFLCALAAAKHLSGVSNIHKSYIDYWLYDRYLVNPVMLSKNQLVNQLRQFQPFRNEYVGTIVDSIQQKSSLTRLTKAVSRVLVSPTCSSTDHLRRLSPANWEYILNSLEICNTVDQITVVFPSESDAQFASFSAFARKYPKLSVQVTSYDAFVDAIKRTDLLITVDSQALHIGQLFSKNTVAIYGPTSPFGVNLGEKTFPITKSLICSPCTHKYLKIPCGESAPCMDFSAIDLDMRRFIS